jgi:hypothetical protein
VIRVDEAVKLSKLADGSGSYDAMTSHSGTDKTYWPIFRSTVAHEVAYLLSDTDTYKKSANQYYVEQAAIAYHDDTSTTISRRLSPISSIDRNSSYNEGARQLAPFFYWRHNHERHLLQNHRRGNPEHQSL